MKIRILVVDDDIGSAQLLKLRLEDNGRYKVYTEYTGAGALLAAHKYRPHMILLDVQMPGQDGGDVAARIQADDDLRRIPIVFITALVSAEEGCQGRLLSGGIPFLSKSIGTSQIIAFVEHKLEGMFSVPSLLNN